MNRIKQWVSQLSVKGKLIFYGYLIFSPVLFIICCVLLFYNYDKNLKKSLEQDINDVTSLAESISVLQTDIKDFSNYLCINDEVKQILTAKNIEKLNSNSQLWLEEAPMRIVRDMIALKGHIKTIAIYPENGVFPYLRGMDGSAYISDIETVRKSTVYKETLAAENDILWKSVPKEDKETYLTNRSDKIVIYREIYDLNQKHPLGFISIGVEKSRFQSLCDSIVRSDKESVVILDPFGGVLCESGNIQEKIRQYLEQEEFVRQNYKSRDSYFTFEGYNVVCIQKEKNSSIICKIVPEYNMQLQFLDIAYAPIILFFCTMVGFLLLFLVISNIVTKPLRQVSAAIQKFSTGDFEQQVDVNMRDEIGEMARCFNKMVEDIKQLIDENYVITLREKESELALLQSQINPHFLYNTLDVLYWQATEVGNDEIAESIFALSQLFRLVLNQGRKEISVCREIELISRYLQIQKLRFSKRLYYTIEIEDAIQEARLPNLILQPFVENAIVHGFENVSTPCKLSVTGRQIGDQIRFEIKDTGIGMSQEQIDMLWVEEPDQYAKQRIGRYAIKNIRERLELKYHNNFKLEIKSNIGEGTTVILQIPFEGGEE